MVLEVKDEKLDRLIKLIINYNSTYYACALRSRYFTETFPELKERVEHEFKTHWGNNINQALDIYERGEI